ncbi:PD40 domain-containing protein [bacterium]|nr:MAG: PD40 domain-containing protein [bacterium]
MKKIIIIIAIIDFFSRSAYAVSLNGTSSLVYQSTLYSPAKNDSVTGFVRLNAGFNPPLRGAVIMDSIISVSGPISGTEFNSTVTLNGDMRLSSKASISNAFDISGHGNTITLEGDMTLPQNQIIALRTDTIIDGNGNTLTFDNRSQLLIENNVTLTLKNLHLRTTRSPFARPCVRAQNETSILALDNVTLALSDDFDWRTGRMYFHHNVRITGTNCFSYRSRVPSYITSGALLTFDPATTLYYNPCSTAKDLIRLVDQSSGLFFNNATLQTTHTGMTLSKGNLWLDNQVSISTKANTKFLGITQKATVAYGTTVHALDWRHDNAFLAVGGTGPTNSNEFHVYSWNGSTLTLITSVNYGTRVASVAWSPSGRFVAIGGWSPSASPGATLETKIYRFDGTTLTLICGFNFRADHASAGVNSLSWRPDEGYIALCGGSNVSTDVQILKFTGVSLTSVATDSFLGDATNPVNGITWTSDGAFIAATGGISGNDTRIYQFTGGAITAGGDESVDTSTGVPFALAFRPDNLFLAISAVNPSGAGGSTNNLKIFSWNGSTLNSITGAAFTSNTTDGIRSLKWSPDGQYILLCGTNPNTGTGLNNELQIWSFDGTSLTFITGIDSAANATGAGGFAVAWSPDGQYIAYGGDTDVDIQVYQVFYTYEPKTQALSNGLTFGNAAEGSNSNLSVNLFSNARVEVAGALVDESV